MRSAARLSIIGRKMLGHHFDPGLAAVIDAIEDALAAIDLGATEWAVECLLKARERCRDRLLEQGLRPESSAAWNEFETACTVAGRSAWWRLGFGPWVLRSKTLRAKERLDEIALEMAAAADPALPAQVAQSLEDLLDCVWRAEGEWKFDDRLALAPAPGGRAVSRA